MTQHIRYDWPAGGPDPFDVEPAETLWVLVDGAGRWGRAWPAGDLRDFGSWGEFEQRVPMGYKVVQVLERLAVVKAGRVRRTWAPTPAETWIGPWGSIGGLPYCALPRSGGAPAGFTSYDEALGAAVAGSAGDASDDSAWIAGRRIAIADWH